MYAQKVDDALKRFRPRLPMVRAYLAEIRNFNQGLDGRLLVGDAESLVGLVQRVETILGGGPPPPALVKLNRQLRGIFDYDGFIKRKGRRDAPWGGAVLMREIAKSVKYCPYCNAETVFAIQIDNAGKPEIKKSAFDHYFPRNRYPFLGLALYNLIPACTRCNSNLKHDRWEGLTDMPHPYLDPDVHSTMRFVPVLHPDGNFSRPLPGNIERLEVVPREKDRGQQTRNYTDVFQTGVVYTALFRQEAADLIWKAVSMTSLYGAVMTQFVADAGLCRQDFERLVWGAPLTAKDINRHRLAKLTIDLEQEFARPRGRGPDRSLSTFFKCFLCCNGKAFP